ncbi:hypothetical protein [Oceanicoccus sagamiensis]|uniref:Uncharacterized protein n=1 Tax=Oceanicoccus sagamiensis TaxID=716816 RepID=A0A1X9NCE7_9GAMM|nr:hypothetical protein [Oceanicoccus sagamiensis]ARN72637.1 hypothetical protein BST96_00020 [Oceanicoccus sagamiensis]ARN76231.1 hypothetical protein BST96_20260 [Oceanicoccus sagamiensis]
MLANWMVFPEYMALGALGAASIEYLKNYELKNNRTALTYRRIIASLVYRFKFLLFLLASGFIAWALNENNPNATVWQIVISGAGANALANKGIEASLSRQELTAGAEDDQPPGLSAERPHPYRITLRDLF